MNSNPRRRGAAWVMSMAYAAAGVGAVVPWTGGVALAAPGQPPTAPRERPKSTEPSKPAEFPALKPVLDDRVTSLEKEIAALIMRRTGTPATAIAQLEMAIDVRVIQRWLLQQTITARPESREQVVGLLRADQLGGVATELEEAMKSLATVAPTRSQGEAMVRLHQISYELKPDADAKTIDEVCHGTALALLNVANPTPIDPQKVPVMRPQKGDAPKGPQKETGAPRTLSSLGEEISRAAVSPPVRAQLMGLLAETQAAQKANDKQAGSLQAVLTDSVDLAMGLAGNVAMSAQTRTDVESDFAEGLALFSDPRTRATGQTRIQALSQYRQLIARVGRMKMSQEVHAKCGPAISWAQNHVEQGAKVLNSLEQFLELTTQYESTPKTPGTIANLRRFTDDAGKAFEKNRDTFLATASEMGSASATTSAPDTLESELGDMRQTLDFYQTLTALPPAIETLNTYKPKPFGGLEQRVIKNAVAATNTVKSPAVTAARTFLSDVVKLARSSDAVGLKVIADIPPAVITAWAGGPLTDFGNKCRTLVTELASQAAAGTELDAKKVARLDAVPQLIAALRGAATLEATLAKGAPLQRWVDWGLTPEGIHTTLAPYQQAVGAAFSGFVSDTPDAVEKFLSARGRYLALISLVERDSIYIDSCAQLPAGLAGSLARLATPMDGQPFATERYLTFALNVAALFSGSDLDASAAATSSGLRRVARDK